MNKSEEEYLEEVNDRNTREYIPAIVIITVVIAVGLFLNVFASVYYGCIARKSVFQIFVMSLSINFVVTNLVLIYDIVELFYFVTFRGLAVCKLFYVLKHWFVANSLFYMVAIGFDRYRTVCFPFSKPLTFRVAWCIILGLTTFSFLLAVRLFVTTDIIPVHITIDHNITIQGRFCSYSESEKLQTVRMIFHFVDISMHSIILFSFVFFYSFIIRKLIITRKKLNVDSKEKVHIEIIRIEPNDHSEITSETSTKCEDLSYVHSDDQSDLNIEDSPLPKRKQYSLPMVLKKAAKTETLGKATMGKSKDESSTNKKNRKKSAKSKTRMERKISIMATVKTVASIVCFAPFYLSMVLISPKLVGDGLLLDGGSILARRSFMLNSAVNPIIMLVFNDDFRRYLKSKFFYIFSNFREKSYRLFH